MWSRSARSYNATVLGLRVSRTCGSHASSMNVLNETRELVDVSVVTELAERVSQRRFRR
jgi:hypothetical protein